ncbi:Spo0B domain-containing protein [Desulfoscipio gibsoniae]
MVKYFLLLGIFTFLLFFLKFPYYYYFYLFTGLNYLLLFFIIVKLENTISSISNLDLATRSQRHNFKNHIQVIYGLLNIDAFEEAK